MSKAKLRSVNTHFWTDGFIIDLDPTEKLLFLYLLTNPLANIAGCYEISLRQIVFDTGIEQSRVTAILTKFETARKMMYRDGWILIVNFLKNQNLNTNMQKGVDTILDASPGWVRETLSNPLKAFERVVIEKQTLVIEKTTLRKDEREVESEDEDESEGEAEPALPPENPAESLLPIADELAIQSVETAFQIRLDLETRRRVVQAIPPNLIDRFPAFISGRAVGWARKTPTEKLARIAYALTDFQKDNKTNNGKPTTDHRQAREQRAIDDRNFFDKLRAEVNGADRQLQETDASDRGGQLRMLGPKPDDPGESLPC